MASVKVGKCESTEKDIEIVYDTFGDPSNDPMLLIAGLGAQMVFWREEFCLKLADAGYYVIRFDNRDSGLSTHLDDVHSPSMVFNHIKSKIKMPPHYAYSLEDMAKDTIGLLDALGLGCVHVVGACLGGIIAQILAIEHGSRVKTMCCIMATTSEPKLPHAKFSVIWQLAKSSPKDPDKSVDHAMRTLRALAHPDYFERERSLLYAEAAVLRSNKDRKGTGRQLAAILVADGRRDALHAKVKVPCLVVHSRQDPLIPFKHAEDLYSALSNCSLTVPEKMGHNLPEICWPMVLDAIIRNARRSAM